MGNFQSNRKFDRDLRYGATRLRSDEAVEIERIEHFNVRDPFDPRNESLIPENGFFRYRSWGVAIAPFVIIDEVGTVFAPLGGFGGLRVNLWFFGALISLPVYPYWHV